MDHKTLHTLTGAIFGVVALMHLIRLVNKWEVIVGPYTIPTWASVVGIVVAGYLSYRMFQDGKKH